MLGHKPIKSARVLRIPGDASVSISVHTITSLVIRRGNRFGSRRTTGIQMPRRWTCASYTARRTDTTFRPAESRNASRRQHNDNVTRDDV